MTKVLFKLTLYDAVVMWKCLRVEAFRNWHWHCFLLVSFLIHIAVPMSLWQGFCSSLSCMTLLCNLCCGNIQESKRSETDTGTCFLLDSWRGKKAAEEERLHNTSPFATSRLSMQRQLRNKLNENHIAFFLSCGVIVAIFGIWCWHFQPARFLVSYIVIFCVGSTWLALLPLQIWRTYNGLERNQRNDYGTV